MTADGLSTTGHRPGAAAGAAWRCADRAPNHAPTAAARRLQGLIGHALAGRQRAIRAERRQVEPFPDLLLNLFAAPGRVDCDHALFAAEDLKYRVGLLVVLP